MKYKAIVFPVVLISFLLNSCSLFSQTEQKTNVISANRDIFRTQIYNYEKNPTEWVLESKIPVLIDFYAVWCGPCKRIAPILEELAGEYKGRVAFFKIDAEKEREIAAMFRVSSYPTIVFANTKGEVMPIPGARSKEEFKLLIEAILLQNPQAIEQLNAQFQQQQQVQQQQQQQTQQAQQANHNTNIVMLDKAGFLKNVYNFEKNPNQWVFEGSLPAIVDFYADWCGPCRAIAPILNELAGEYKGKIVVYKVDIQKHPELARQFQVNNIPTLFFVPKNGDKQVHMGARSKEEFRQLIESVLLKK